MIVRESLLHKRSNSARTISRPAEKLAMELTPSQAAPGSGTVEVVGFRFQVKVCCVPDLLGLRLPWGEACQQRVGKARLLHVAEHGRIARAGEPARGGGSIVESSEGVDEPQLLRLQARVYAAVGDLTDPLLWDTAALGDHVDELGV